MAHSNTHFCSEELLQAEVKTIVNRIALACKEIPGSITDLTDDQFEHGHEQCRQLPPDARDRDRWIHCIFYEIVSTRILVQPVCMSL